MASDICIVYKQKYISMETISGIRKYRFLKAVKNQKRREASFTGGFLTKAQELFDFYRTACICIEKFEKRPGLSSPMASPSFIDTGNRK